MSLDKMELSQNPTILQQAKCRAFMANGVEEERCYYLGACEKRPPVLSSDAEYAIRSIKARLPYAHWLGTLEIYLSGFNVYVRSAFAEHAVEVWRYRVEE